MTYASLEHFRDVTSRNVLALQEAREKGRKVVGQFCIYSPLEIALAAGAVPVSLCGTKQDSIPVAEEVLPRKYEEDGVYADVIVVDPPRKGGDETLLETIVKMEPEKVVYVSCDPATLARDLKLLTAVGYTLQTAEAFDLFPRCAHVETVCLLSKRNAKQHIEV